MSSRLEATRLQDRRIAAQRDAEYIHQCIRMEEQLVVEQYSEQVMHLDVDLRHLQDQHHCSVRGVGRAHAAAAAFAAAQEADERRKAEQQHAFNEAQDVRFAQAINQVHQSQKLDPAATYQQRRMRILRAEREKAARMRRQQQVEQQRRTSHAQQPSPHLAILQRAQRMAGVVDFSSTHLHEQPPRLGVSRTAPVAGGSRVPQRPLGQCDQDAGNSTATQERPPARHGSSVASLAARAAAAQAADSRSQERHERAIGRLSSQQQLQEVEAALEQYEAQRIKARRRPTPKPAPDTREMQAELERVFEANFLAPTKPAAAAAGARGAGRGASKQHVTAAAAAAADDNALGRPTHSDADAEGRDADAPAHQVPRWALNRAPRVRALPADKPAPPSWTIPPSSPPPRPLRPAVPLRSEMTRSGSSRQEPSAPVAGPAGSVAPALALAGRNGGTVSRTMGAAASSQPLPSLPVLPWEATGAPDVQGGDGGANGAAGDGGDGGALPATGSSTSTGRDATGGAVQAAMPKAARHNDRAGAQQVDTTGEAAGAAATGRGSQRDAAGGTERDWPAGGSVPPAGGYGGTEIIRGGSRRAAAGRRRDGRPAGTAGTADVVGVGRVQRRPPPQPAGEDASSTLRRGVLLTSSSSSSSSSSSDDDGGSAEGGPTAGVRYVWDQHLDRELDAMADQLGIKAALRASITSSISSDDSVPAYVDNLLARHSLGLLNNRWIDNATGVVTSGGGDSAVAPLAQQPAGADWVASGGAQPAAAPHPVPAAAAAAAAAAARHSAIRSGADVEQHLRLLTLEQLLQLDHGVDASLDASSDAGSGMLSLVDDPYSWATGHTPARRSDAARPADDAAQAAGSAALSGQPAPPTWSDLSALIREGEAMLLASGSRVQQLLSTTTSSISVPPVSHASSLSSVLPPPPPPMFPATSPTAAAPKHVAPSAVAAASRPTAAVAGSVPLMPAVVGVSPPAPPLAALSSAGVGGGGGAQFLPLQQLLREAAALGDVSAAALDAKAYDTTGRSKARGPLPSAAASHATLLKGADSVADEEPLREQQRQRLLLQPHQQHPPHAWQQQQHSSGIWPPQLHPQQSHEVRQHSTDIMPSLQQGHDQQERRPSGAQQQQQLQRPQPAQWQQEPHVYTTHVYTSSAVAYHTSIPPAPTVVLPGSTWQLSAASVTTGSPAVYQQAGDVQVHKSYSSAAMPAPPMATTPRPPVAAFAPGGGAGVRSVPPPPLAAPQGSWPTTTAAVASDAWAHGSAFGWTGSGMQGLSHDLPSPQHLHVRHDLDAAAVGGAAGDAPGSTQRRYQDLREVSWQDASDAAVAGHARVAAGVVDGDDDAALLHGVGNSGDDARSMGENYDAAALLRGIGQGDAAAASLLRSMGLLTLLGTGTAMAAAAMMGGDSFLAESEAAATSDGLHSVSLPAADWSASLATTGWDAPDSAPESGALSFPSPELHDSGLSGSVSLSSVDLSQRVGTAPTPHHDDAWADVSASASANLSHNVSVSVETDLHERHEQEAATALWQLTHHGTAVPVEMYGRGDDDGGGGGHLRPGDWRNSLQLGPSDDVASAAAAAPHFVAAVSRGSDVSWRADVARREPGFPPVASEASCDVTSQARAHSSRVLDGELDNARDAAGGRRGVAWRAGDELGLLMDHVMASQLDLHSEVHELLAGPRA